MPFGPPSSALPGCRRTKGPHSPFLGQQCSCCLVLLFVASQPAGRQTGRAPRWSVHCLWEEKTSTSLHTTPQTSAPTLASSVPASAMASTTAISRTGSRLPMTTPFAIPSICTGNFNSTTTITKTYAAYESVTVRLFDVAPDAEACHYGQAPKPTARHLALGFSPAVCPSAWTAYSLEMDPLGRGKARQSFAWCCPRSAPLISPHPPQALSRQVKLHIFC